MLNPEWPTGRPACHTAPGRPGPAPPLPQSARDRIRRPCAHAEQVVRFRCAGDNGCNYGACFSPVAIASTLSPSTAGYHTRCVHDASFCSTTEQYYTAEQVLTPSPANFPHLWLLHIFPILPPCAKSRR